MNLIHVITSLDVGGAQQLLADLLPLLKRGTNLQVIVFNKCNSAFETKLEQEGVKIISLNIKNFYSPLILKKIRPFLKKQDIVHVHLFPTLYWVAIATLGLRCKLIYTEHSTHNRRRNIKILRPLEKLIYSRYKYIISISTETKENLITWLKLKAKDKFITICNGVDLLKFNSTGIIPEKLITMVSRFAEAKDQATLIRAMKYVNPEFRLLLVGDGKTRVKCEKIAMDEGLSDRINFLGTRTDVPEIIKKSYIGVQSSKWEGFGLTAVEFMAAGKPIIFSNVKGLSNVVGNAGLMFNVGDFKTLAEQINTLIASKETYYKLSNQAIERAKNFSIQHMYKKYLELYQQINPIN